MTVTPVLKTERENWGTNSMIIKVYDGVYICTYSLLPADYHHETKHAFVYDSNFKPLYQRKC